MAASATKRRRIAELSLTFAAVALYDPYQATTGQVRLSSAIWSSKHTPPTSKPNSPKPHFFHLVHPTRHLPSGPTPVRPRPPQRKDADRALLRGADPGHQVVWIPVGVAGEKIGALVSLAWRWVMCAGASGTPLMKEAQGGISWASMRWTRIRLGPLSSPHHPSRSLALTTSKLHILPNCTWPQNMTPTMHFSTPNPQDNRTKLEVDGGPTHPPLGSSGFGQEVALSGPSCQ